MSRGYNSINSSICKFKKCNDLTRINRYLAIFLSKIFVFGISLHKFNAQILTMHKIIPIIISVFLAMCGSSKAANKPHASMYHKGWIDFNKNGVMDAYEDPLIHRQNEQI